MNGSYNQSGDGVIVLTCDFYIMSCNQAAQQILGTSFAPNQHCPLEKVFSESELSMAQLTVEKVLSQKKQSDCIKTRIQKNGEIFFFEYSVTPLFKNDEKVLGLIFCFRNLKPLPHSLYRMDFQILFEKLPEGVFTINTDFYITSFNQTAEKITGLKRENVIGQYCWDIFQSNQCHQECPLFYSLKTGQTCLGKEININIREHQSILVNTNVLHDQDGSIMGAVETFREITPKARPQLNRKKYIFNGIIGKSSAMQSIFAALPDIAVSEANVIITGESGTGKDLIARTIHDHSHRSKGPFIAINCMEFAESLLESELFGHEKGAFTGAVQTKPGRLELANGGTLFLDEIGELKLEMQIKLLRVLEQKTFMRVGGRQSLNLETRIISATNQNLEQALKQRKFREDLFYRLHTVPVNMSPLRERIEDIPFLVEHFIKKLNVKYHKTIRSVDPKVIRIFSKYTWPGNVRELERCVEHAFVFVKGPVIFARYLPDAINFHTKFVEQSQFTPFDKDTILAALKQTGGKRREAAEILGISRTSLWRKMKDYGLSEK